MQTELAAPLRAALATMSADDTARMKGEAREALAPWTDEGGRVAIPASPLCARARAS